MNISYRKYHDIYPLLVKKYGQKMIEYRKRWDDAGQGILFKYPIHLNIEITRGCNLSCDFCILNSSIYKDKINKSNKSIIPFDKYCKIIDEGVENGLCSIAFNGNNEPLLFKNIFNYIKYANEKGIIETSLHTNGILLNKNMIDSIIKSGLSILMISLDAYNSDTYFNMRKYDINVVKNNIEEFLKVRKIKNVKFPLVRLSFLKTKFNQNELLDFIKYWKDRIDFFEIQSFINPAVDDDKYDSLELKYRLESKSNKFCSQPYQRLLIQSNGDVSPCCSYYGYCNIIDNIYKQSIYDIWNSKKMKKLRILINCDDVNKQPVFCRKCREGFI